jgi:hypothetical protein
MLTGLLELLGGLLSAVGNLVGGLVGGLLDGLGGGERGGSGVDPDVTAGASAGDLADADALVTGVIAEMSAGANELLASALSGTDALVETGVADGARALGEMAEGVAGLVESTSYTTYYPDGTVTYVTEVLAPQTDTLGAGVHQFMLQTGAGVGQALDGLTHYDLSYTSTNYGTSRLALEHGLG